METGTCYFIDIDCFIDNKQNITFTDRVCNFGGLNEGQYEPNSTDQSKVSFLKPASGYWSHRSVIWVNPNVHDTTREFLTQHVAGSVCSRVVVI